MAELKDDAWFVANKGRQIGEGGARTVFECVSDSSSVIKEMHKSFPGTNFIEHFIWNAVRETELAAAFGEVKAISQSAKYILMERLNDLEEADKKKTPSLPEWVRDVWANNFGKNARGEIKIRDYGNVDISEELSASQIFRKQWQT